MVLPTDERLAPVPNYLKPIHLCDPSRQLPHLLLVCQQPTAPGHKCGGTLTLRGDNFHLMYVFNKYVLQNYIFYHRRTFERLIWFFIFIFNIYLRSAHDFKDGFLIVGFRMKCDRCAHKAFTTSDAILGQLSIVQRSMYPFQLSGQSGLSQV